jgi:hypothetical protein
MIYSISYDLRRPGRNYEKLYSIIKTASDWIHAMDSLWFISTDQTVSYWSEKLMKAIDRSDYLYVVDVTGQSYHGWMQETVWNWIEKHDRQQLRSFI